MMGSIGEIKTWQVGLLRDLAQKCASFDLAGEAYIAAVSGKLSARDWTGDARGVYDGAAKSLEADVEGSSRNAGKLGKLTSVYATTAQQIKSSFEKLDAEALANDFLIGADGAVIDSSSEHFDVFASLSRQVLKGSYEGKAQDLVKQEDLANNAYADAINSGGYDPGEFKNVLSGYDYTDEDLYGPSGQPSADDVHQTFIGNCWLDATMAALAQTDPNFLKEHIKYNPDTGNFEVSLWNGMQWQTVEVSSQDVRDNILATGASARDDGVGDAPIWPAVLENAYARLKYPDSEASNMRAKLEKTTGGQTKNAMNAFTGSKGESGMVGLGPDLLYAQMDEALRDHKAVTLSTDQLSLFATLVAGPKGDGMVPDHAYSVEKVYTAPDGTQRAVLRNPWGSNPDSSSPTIDVALQDIIKSGRLDSVNIRK